MNSVKLVQLDGLICALMRRLNISFCSVIFTNILITNSRKSCDRNCSFFLVLLCRFDAGSLSTQMCFNKTFCWNLVVPCICSFYQNIVRSKWFTLSFLQLKKIVLNLLTHPFSNFYTGPLLKACDRGLLQQSTSRSIDTSVHQDICFVWLIFFIYLLYLLNFRTREVICSLLECVAYVRDCVKSPTAYIMNHICQKTIGWRLEPYAELVKVSSGSSW